MTNRDDDRTDELSKLLRSLMSRYVRARAEPFKNHEVHGIIREIGIWFRRANAIRKRPTLKVRYSVGMGNWAVVPSVAFVDTRETSSISEGVYVIILFRGDMSGFYVTLNQGITKPVAFVGRTKARALLRERAELVRQRFPQLVEAEDAVNDAIDIRAQDKFQDLADATIAYEFFGSDETGDGSAIVACVEKLLDVYDRYLEDPIRIDADRSTWIRSQGPSQGADK